MEATKNACHATANYFSSLASDSFDPELMQLCADGLREVAENYEEYSSVVSTASPFLRELSEKVKLIAHDAKREAELQHDHAFSLMESMAVVLREVLLRKGASVLKPAHHKLLDFFEGSGHWKANEGSMVTDYYYNRIPITVLQDLQAQMAKIS